MALSQETTEHYTPGTDQWPSLVDELVCEHKQRPAMIEIFSATGMLIEARIGILGALAFDNKRPAQYAFVQLEEAVRGSVTHVVANPTRLSLRQRDAHRELEITSADGRRIVITFGLMNHLSGRLSGSQDKC